MKIIELIELDPFSEFHFCNNCQNSHAQFSWQLPIVDKTVDQKKHATCITRLNCDKLHRLYAQNVV